MTTNAKIDQRDGLETVNGHTWAEYTAGRLAGRRCFLETFQGVEEITGQRPTDCNCVCGRSNAGFGTSYAVHGDTPILVALTAEEAAANAREYARWNADYRGETAADLMADIG